LRVGYSQFDPNCGYSENECIITLITDANTRNPDDPFAFCQFGWRSHFDARPPMPDDAEISTVPGTACEYRFRSAAG